MAKESLEAMLEAASKILSETVQITFEHKEPHVKDGVFTAHDVTTLVGVSGDLEGAIIISFTHDSALSAAGRFMEVMGAPPATELNDHANSALAELINTISGHYMIAMEARGFKVSITPVTVITGEKVNFGVDGIKKVVAVPLFLSVGPAEINIAMK